MKRTLALIATILLAPACQRESDAKSTAAAASASVSAIASASSSSWSDAPITAERFCAHMERLILAQMNKADAKDQLPLATKRENAKKMNAGCVATIEKVAERQPGPWQICAHCLIAKEDFVATKQCDAVCRDVGPTHRAPAPSASLAASVAASAAPPSASR